MPHLRCDANTSRDSDSRAYIVNAIVGAVITTIVLGLTLCTGLVCNFITITAKTSDLLAITSYSHQTTQNSTTVGIYCMGDFYNLENDTMWNISRIFLSTSIALASISTILSWVIVIGILPTRTLIMWRIISVFAACCAIIQIPIFLIYQIGPCVDYVNEQQCSMDIGSYTLMCSIAGWIKVTIITQCLDPLPNWVIHLDEWKAPTGYTELNHNNFSNTVSTSSRQQPASVASESRSISSLSALLRSFNRRNQKDDVSFSIWPPLSAISEQHSLPKQKQTFKSSLGSHKKNASKTKRDQQPLLVPVMEHYENKESSPNDEEMGLGYDYIKTSTSTKALQLVLVSGTAEAEHGVVVTNTNSLFEKEAKTSEESRSSLGSLEPTLLQISPDESILDTPNSNIGSQDDDQEQPSSSVTAQPSFTPLKDVHLSDRTKKEIMIANIPKKEMVATLPHIREQEQKHETTTEAPTTDGITSGSPSVADIPVPITCLGAIELIPCIDSASMTSEVKNLTNNNKFTIRLPRRSRKRRKFRTHKNNEGYAYLSDGVDDENIYVKRLPQSPPFEITVNVANVSPENSTSSNQVHAESEFLSEDANSTGLTDSKLQNQLENEEEMADYWKSIGLIYWPHSDNDINPGAVLHWSDEESTEDDRSSVDDERNTSTETRQTFSSYTDSIIETIKGMRAKRLDRSSTNRRQKRRRKRKGTKSVRSAPSVTSLISYTIEEETQADLEESDNGEERYTKFDESLLAMTESKGVTQENICTTSTTALPSGVMMARSSLSSNQAKYGYKNEQRIGTKTAEDNVRMTGINSLNNRVEIFWGSSRAEKMNDINTTRSSHSCPERESDSDSLSSIARKHRQRRISPLSVSKEILNLNDDMASSHVTAKKRGKLEEERPIFMQQRELMMGIHAPAIISPRASLGSPEPLINDPIDHSSISSGSSSSSSLKQRRARMARMKRLQQKILNIKSNNPRTVPAAKKTVPNNPDLGGMNSLSYQQTSRTIYQSNRSTASDENSLSYSISLNSSLHTMETSDKELPTSGIALPNTELPTPGSFSTNVIPDNVQKLSTDEKIEKKIVIEEKQDREIGMNLPNIVSSSAEKLDVDGCLNTFTSSSHCLEDRRCTKNDLANPSSLLTPGRVHPSYSMDELASTLTPLSADHEGLGSLFGDFSNPLSPIPTGRDGQGSLSGEFSVNTSMPSSPEHESSDQNWDELYLTDILEVRLAELKRPEGAYKGPDEESF